MHHIPAVIDEDAWTRISRQPNWRGLEVDNLVLLWDLRRDWDTFPCVKNSLQRCPRIATRQALGYPFGRENLMRVAWDNTRITEPERKLLRKIYAVCRRKTNAMQETGRQ